MNERAFLQPEVRALYAIIEAMNSRLSHQNVLTTMLERTVKELSYHAATLRLLDEEQQTLELKAAYGLSEEYLRKGAVKVEESLIDQRALQGERVMVADVRSDPSFQYSEAAQREGLVSALAVPLRVRERITGVLHVYSDQPYDFNEQEQLFLELLANLGGQIILRTRLYEAFQVLASQVNSHLDVSNVLTTLLVRLVRELNVKAGSIRLLDPARKQLHLVAAYGLSQSYTQKGDVELAKSRIDQQALAGQPLVVDDVIKSGLLQYPEEAYREGIRSMLVLPLRVHGVAIGVMRTYSRQVRRFTPEEIAFASTAADLGAIAIENAKLHEELRARLEALKEDTDGWYRFLSLS